MNATKTMIFAAAAGLAAGMAADARGAAITTVNGVDPWLYNVVSTNDITYTGNVAGVMVSGGNASLTSISVHTNASTGAGLGYSVFTKGDVTLAGSINNGGVYTEGSLQLNGASVYGNVLAKANLKQTGNNGGTVHGNATLGGVKTGGNKVGVTGTLLQHQSITGSFDFDGLFDYFKDTSDFLAGVAATTSVTNQYGELQVTLADGLNVVNIDANTYKNAWGFKVTGSTDSTLVINLTGSTVNFDSITFNLLGGVSSSDILLNVNASSPVTFSGGTHVSILAPYSDVNFTSGQLNGNVIAGKLLGGGTIGAGMFDAVNVIAAMSPSVGAPSGSGGASSAIPEPTTGLLLLAGATLLMRRVRNA